MYLIKKDYSYDDGDEDIEYELSGSPDSYHPSVPVSIEILKEAYSLGDLFDG